MQLAYQKQVLKMAEVAATAAAESTDNTDDVASTVSTIKVTHVNSFAGMSVTQAMRERVFRSFWHSMVELMRHECVEGYHRRVTSRAFALLEFTVVLQSRDASGGVKKCCASHGSADEPFTSVYLRCGFSTPHI